MKYDDNGENIYEFIEHAHVLYKICEALHYMAARQQMVSKLYI